MDAERLQVGRQKIKLRERKELSWRLTKRMGGLTFKGIWTRWGDRTEVKGRLIQVTGISFIFLHCLVSFFSFTKLRDNFLKVILEPTTLIPPIWLGSRHLMKWSRLFFSFLFFLRIWNLVMKVKGKQIKDIAVGIECHILILFQVSCHTQWKAKKKKVDFYLESTRHCI